MSTDMTREMSALYLLADHLDAILATGEDLQRLRADAHEHGPLDAVSAPIDADAWQSLPKLVSTAQALELRLMSRVLQARTRARDIGRQDAVVGTALKLFAAATAQLADALPQLGDSTSTDFDAGLDPLAYLRSRAVMSADCGSLIGIQSISISEEFLVLGLSPLGLVMEMAARLLDVLDAAYGIYDEPNGVAGELASPLGPQPSRSQKLGQP
ncbi:MAG: hypothetical protein AB7O43_04880 [Hyphomicrobiaceae bacterium]